MLPHPIIISALWFTALEVIAPMRAFALIWEHNTDPLAGVKPRGNVYAYDVKTTTTSEVGNETAL